MTKDSDMKMAGEKSLDIQVKTLEKGMGTLVRAFKELKENVKALEDKVENKYHEEVKEIKENQKRLEDLLRDNSEAIKKIENVMSRKEEESSKAEVEETNKSKIKKKCRHFNSGHCRYKSDCRFSHPIETCKIYLEEGKCERKQCKDRNPKICKWWQGRRGCKRYDCDNLHATLARDDGQLKMAHKDFPCDGCKSGFQDIICVVQHEVNDVGFNLCLNWIKHKEMVLMSGWTIFDQNQAKK